MMSLTLRLTLLFSLVSVCILAGLGLRIQRSVENHFATEDFAEIEDKLNQVISILNQAPAPVDKDAMAAVLNELVLSHSYLELHIKSSSGQTLFASGPLSFPLPAGESLQPGKRYRAEWSSQDTGYRGITLLLSEATSAGQGVIITGGIETTRHTLFMQTFAAQLLTFMLLATLLSTLLGWLAVRKGLAHFSSDIAHELRTPLSNLMTQTQVSLSWSRTCKEYSDIIASNLEEFERLSRMA